MKDLVVYFSRTGNNRFLAERIARDLNADIEPIRPRLNVFFFLLISSLTHVTFGIRKLKKDVASYECVILVGPIWMGSLITPFRSFLKKYKMALKSVYFVTCCGSDEKEKDGKFGYNRVFKKAEKYAGRPCELCEAFSIKLVVPEDKRDDDKAIMEARLTNESFKGPFKQKYDQFLSKLFRISKG